MPPPSVGGPGASPLRAGVGGLDAILRQVQSLARELGETGQASFAARAGSQRELDSAAAGVDAAVRHIEDGGDDWPGYQVIGVSPDISAYHLHRVDLKPGEALTPAIEVQASAQLGGLYFSAAIPSVNLNPMSSMTLRITGGRGSAELTFSSGTTLAAIAAALNTMTGQTGVSGVASGTGIRFETDGYGSDQFVSVNVVSGGGLTGSNVGLYELTSDNFVRADPKSHSGWSTGLGVSDRGQDVSATVNGVKAHGRGEFLRFDLPEAAGWLRLTTGRATSLANAQTLGTFRPFRILGRP
ncbi:MAG: flagellin hook IN motif-containing protein [Phycisphaerales bacterium]